MAFCFVHTADLHLDAPLKALALRDPELAAQVGAASRGALSRIIDLCIEQEAAFLLISGDLWDGHATTKTPRFVKQELMRLRAHDIKAFLIRGNHDATSQTTGELELPENATLFGHKAATKTLSIQGHNIAIHGLSFRDPHAPQSLLPLYPAPIKGAFNIGMMHTSLNGSPDHDPYAPCALADLQAFGYDYWALGHIHKYAEYHGAATVVMPGIPQGRDIGESGEKSGTLVRVDDGETLTLERHAVANARFDSLVIDCSDADLWADLLQLIEAALTKEAQKSQGVEHKILRLFLTGTPPLAWRMARDFDQLNQELRALAFDAGLWIDKVILQMDVAGAAKQKAYAQLPGELVDFVLKGIDEDPALLAAITQEAEILLRKMPAQSRDIFGTTPQELEQNCRALLQEGAPITLTAFTLSEAK